MKYEEAINAIEQFAKDIKKDKSFSKATKEGAVIGGHTAMVAGALVAGALGPIGPLARALLLASEVAVVAGNAKGSIDEFKLLLDNLSRECSRLKNGRSKDTIKIFSEAYKKSKSKDIRAKLAYILYLIHKDDSEWNEARKWCTHVIDSEANSATIGDVFISEKASSDLVEIEECLSQNFLNFPYSKRRLIVPMDSYSGLRLSNCRKIVVLDVNHLPSKLKFTTPYAITNQLYVGHPRVPSLYIPFENYELELLEDKIREYCMVMQYLGATEISIEAIKSTDRKEDYNRNRKLSGGADVKAFSGSGTYEGNTKNNLLEAISQRMELHQVFKPKNKPTLPEDLVWYEHEPSWQSTYKQRMHGTLLEHEERIETKKSQVVSNSELTDISGELKYLYTSVNAHWTESTELMFETQDNATLAIKVKFAPLESLK